MPRRASTGAIAVIILTGPCGVCSSGARNNTLMGRPGAVAARTGRCAAGRGDCANRDKPAAASAAAPIMNRRVILVIGNVPFEGQILLRFVDALRGTVLQTAPAAISRRDTDRTRRTRSSRSRRIGSRPTGTLLPHLDEVVDSPTALRAVRANREIDRS